MQTTVAIEEIIHRVRELDVDMLSRGRLDTRDAIEIGRLMNRAKELVGRGFMTWVTENCRYSYGHYWRFRKLARAADEFHNLRSLPLCEALRAAGLLRFRTPREESRGTPRPAGDVTGQAVAQVPEGMPAPRLVDGRWQVEVSDPAVDLLPLLADPGLLRRCVRNGGLYIVERERT